MHTIVDVPTFSVSKTPRISKGYLDPYLCVERSALKQVSSCAFENDTIFLCLVESPVGPIDNIVNRLASPAPDVRINQIMSLLHACHRIVCLRGKSCCKQALSGWICRLSHHSCCQWGGVSCYSRLQVSIPRQDLCKGVDVVREVGLLAL